MIIALIDEDPHQVVLPRVYITIQTIYKVLMSNSQIELSVRLLCSIRHAIVASSMARRMSS